MRRRRNNLTCKTTVMADKYKDFADLAAHEGEGADYQVRSEVRRSATAIIAPHGGGIEPGTS